ncbi:MAG: YdeI/OmpD-associated family protein [Dehalococcoidia bacterium]|nr:YdeI/OmpD-associated family protein [Dehalococcoidia bacterium]MDD5493813.1 YdeI/OmpD-associated family protein [Dehalococcoidia bacterium]
MDADKALHCKSRQEWRKWLEENSSSAQEIWLLHYKKHTGKASVSHDDAVEEALCFGWIDGKLKSIDGDKFILRYSPRKSNSVWSKINKDKAEQMIARGRMTEAGLARIEEARKNGNWDKAYTNRIKDEMPADLEKALREDSTAWNNFMNFANSYRNMYVGWVSSSKTDETRKRRIAEVVKRSALNRKPGIQ